MNHPLDPTEVQRADAAARAVEEASARGRLVQYRLLVRNLPIWLHQHGLGQTLAYLQSRAAGRTDSPYYLIHEHLAGRLRDRLGLPAGDVLIALTRGDSRLYLLASEETGAFLLALRRALAGEGADPGAGSDGASPKEGD